MLSKSPMHRLFGLLLQFRSFAVRNELYLPELHEDQTRSVQSFGLRRLGSLVQDSLFGWCFWNRVILLASGEEPLLSVFRPWTSGLGRLDLLDSAF